MRPWILIALLAVAAGCTTTVPPRPAAPTATPVAAPTPIEAPPVEPAPSPIPLPAPTSPIPSDAVTGWVDAAIRVLLERGSGPFVLPQPGRAYRAEIGGETVWLWGPLELTVVGEAAWQVGAWSTPEAADTVVRGLSRRFEGALRVWDEPTGTGLYRVKLQWPGGDPADAKALLAAAGHGDAFRVAGGGVVKITGAAGSAEAPSDVVLTPAGDWPTVVSGRRYRGRFRIRLSGGELLLINEIGIEDYLRGVVPVEMGPYVFPELEALKAQAVAARTYAVAHLGDHDDEGWDICDTPACQAYHGSGAEHGLTDRAVAETAGLIAVFDGVPIDAMYTSTCGGHTEDSTELFSGRAHPYLKGVACAWDRPLVLVGETTPEPIGDSRAFRRELALRALDPDGDGLTPESVLPRVAEFCGGTLRPMPAVIDLATWIEALFAAGGLDESSPLVAGEGAGRLVELADLFGIPLPPPSHGLGSDGWYLEAVSAVLEIQEIIRVDSGELVPHPDGAAIYPRRADASEALPRPLPLVSRWGGSYGGASAVRALPGTALERYRMGDLILALVVVQSDGGGEADRRSAWRSWRRERSWSELEASLGEPDLERLEVVRRGRSGRVVTLAVVDGSGNRRLIKGFDVRRALDLPETLFEMHVRTRPDGERVAHFLGRGWGHGIGLCQNGAYGLARSGMSFETILKHYYTGVEVVPWR